MRSPFFIALSVCISACGSPIALSDGGHDSASDGFSDVTHLADVIHPSDGMSDVAPTDTMTDAGTDAMLVSDVSTGPRIGACVPALPTPTPDVQTPRMKGSTCGALGYYEYVPANYASMHNWPLIIEFHGDGERGNGTTDLPLLLNAGLPAMIHDRTWDPMRRFVVLSPQMDDRGGMTERTGPSVRAFIEFAIANYDVDIHRIYLTGYSGGAEPIYNYLGNESNVVAAVLPISGWYSTQNRECSWSTVPIWYFHGAMDTTVPPAAHSTLSYDNLIACTPPPSPTPRYTLFRDRAHDDWNLVYDLSGMNAATYPVVTTPPGTTPYDVSIYDWFLSHSH